MRGLEGLGIGSEGCKPYNSAMWQAVKFDANKWAVRVKFRPSFLDRHFRLAHVVDRDKMQQARWAEYHAIACVVFIDKSILSHTVRKSFVISGYAELADRAKVNKINIARLMHVSFHWALAPVQV